MGYRNLLLRARVQPDGGAESWALTGLTAEHGGSPPPTSRTRTAIMAAAPVETVLSMRMTWSSPMSLGRRR